MFVITDQEACNVAGLLRQIDFAIAGVTFAVDVGVVQADQESIPRCTQEAEMLLVIQFDAENVGILMTSARRPWVVSSRPLARRRPS